MPIEAETKNSLPPRSNGCSQRLADARGHGLGDEQRRVGAGRAGALARGRPAAAGTRRRAEARDHVGLARAHAEALRQLDQQLVAGVVAQRVVHELEVVQVQEQDADAEVEPAGTRERALEHLLEQRTVRQTGQLVVVREERDLLLGRLALGDVEDHALDQPRFAVAVVDRERLLHHPLDRAVLVHHPVLVVQGDVCPVGVLVLLPHAVDVVDVDVAAPAVRIAQPVRRCRCPAGPSPAG